MTIDFAHQVLPNCSVKSAAIQRIVTKEDDTYIFHSVKLVASITAYWARVEEQLFERCGLGYIGILLLGWSVSCRRARISLVAGTLY